MTPLPPALAVPFTVGTLIAAIALFIWEPIPAELTALAACALLIACGIVSPADGLAGFGSSAVLTLLGFFVISAGLNSSGAFDGIRSLMASSKLRHPRRQIALMGLLLGPVSGFIANTPLVASFLPVVEGWCRRRGVAPSRLLLPLSYVTVLGGTLTLLGTSTNLVAAQLIDKLGIGHLGLFTMTPIGIPVYLVGVTYLLFSQRLLPERDPQSGRSLAIDWDLETYLTEVSIPAGSPLVGQTLRSSSLQRRYDLDVVEIIRGAQRLELPLSDRPLQSGDILMLRCSRQELLRLRSEESVTLVPQGELASLPDADNPTESGSDRLVELLVTDGSLLQGGSLRELRFRQRFNATVLAVRRGRRVIRERLGRVPLLAGDVLLVQAPMDSIRGLQNSNDVVVLQQIEDERLTQGKGVWALGIFAVTLLVASFNVMPLVAAALLGAIAMVVSGCLSPGRFMDAVRWDVLILIGALMAFEEAFKATGLTSQLADFVSGLGRQLPPLASLYVVYAMTVALTEVLSNVATVALLLPVGVAIAQQLGQPPMAFALAITFAASNSFMTPVGYQTNLMVYGPGGYRYMDVVKYGAPLSLLLLGLTPFLIGRQYGLI